MQNPAYLTLSELNIYHFRWPLPLRFMPDNKRRYIKLSLGTREPQQALHLSKHLSYAAQHLIKCGRWQGMDFIEIKEIVQTYLQRALAEAKEQMDWRGADTTEVKLYRTISAHPEGYEYGLFNTEEETRMLRAIWERMELPAIDESHPEWERLKQVYRAAVPQYCKEVLKYADNLTGSFNFEPPSAKPVLEALPQPSRLHNAAYTVGQVITKFIAVHVNDEAWDENTKNNREAKLDVLREILGTDFLIADVDLMKARDVRDIVKQLPRNLNKNPLVRNLPLMEAIKVEQAEKISAVTAQMYLNSYSTFFQWCLAEGMVSSNPFAKLKASVDKKKKNVGIRKPFSAEQIKRIQAATKDEDKHYRRWGTLLGMYTGARLNEVSQILLDDIKQKDGIWYFHMNDDGEDKKLKTPAARRLVPVHKVLLEHGIIQEVERLRKAGRDRFLYDLTYCKKNGYGKKLGTYFNTVLLVQLGIKRKELVFHSFRHTANTCLYQAGVPEAIVHMLIGHERSGTSQQVYFKEGYTLQQLKDAMDKYDPASIIINSD